MRTDDILVTVIMPSYNSEEKYFREAIESVLGQTHSNLELLITIDGSTNGDIEIANEYANNDNRVKIIDNNGNKGLAYSLNNMISLSKGSVVFRMDSDDVCCKNRIKDTLKYFDKHPEVEICGAQVRNIIDGRIRLKKTRMPLIDSNIKASMLFCNPIIHPTVAIKKQILLNSGCRYTEGVKSEDYRMWTDCAMNGIVFGNINRVLLNYRKHANQITSKDSEKLFLSGFETFSYFLDNSCESLSDNEKKLFFEYTRSLKKISSSDIIKVNKIMIKIANSFSVDGVKTKKSVFSKRFSRDLFKQVIRKNTAVSKVKVKDIPVIKYSISALMSTIICIFISKGMRLILHG